MKKFYTVLLALLLIPSAVKAEEISDPIEGFNRGVFWFNDQFDTYLLEPVARGYSWIMPDLAEEGVSNFVDNLRYPQYAVSNLLQGDMEQVGRHTARFIFNTVFGLAGIFDVASALGFKEANTDDFDMVLASYGTPKGPYIVLPFLGPSSLRHVGGRVADGFFDPAYWVGVQAEEGEIITGSLKGLELINFRASKLDAVDAAKSGTLDYYAAVRAVYYQTRNSMENEDSNSDDDDDFLDGDWE